MKIAATNLKTFIGDRGPVSSCSVLLDGRKVGTYCGDACGGEGRFHWTDAAAGAALVAWAETLPPEDLAGISVPVDLEHVVLTLCDELEWRRKARRIMRSRTMFRLKTDPAGEYRILKVHYGPAVRDRLYREYGAEIETVLNEKPKET
jgi:hypothetical protein